MGLGALKHPSGLHCCGASCSPLQSTCCSSYVGLGCPKRDFALRNKRRVEEREEKGRRRRKRENDKSAGRKVLNRNTMYCGEKLRIVPLTSSFIPVSSLFLSMCMHLHFHKALSQPFEELLLCISKAWLLG